MTVGWYIQSAKRKKTCQTLIPYPEKLPFKSEGEIKRYLDKYVGWNEILLEAVWGNKDMKKEIKLSVIQTTIYKKDK